MNASLVSGLNNPAFIAVSGGNLFVANYANNVSGGGTIGEYDVTTGATVNPALVSGLNGPVGITALGGNLFVASNDNNTIGEYTQPLGRP